MKSLKFRLAQLYESCDCQQEVKHEQHYISFDETFQRLREVTDDVLDYLDKRRDIRKFTFGQTYVNSKTGKEFNFQRHETWSKRGVKEDLKMLKDKGFSEVVIIGCIKDDLISDDACKAMRDPEKYATALRDRLVMHYLYQKPDDRLHSKPPIKMKDSEEKSEGRLIYIAFKFYEKKKEKLTTEQGQTVAVPDDQLILLAQKRILAVQVIQTIGVKRSYNRSMVKPDFM